MMYYPESSLFDDFFGTNQDSLAMKTDIQEMDGFYQLNMDLPGISKDDIRVELNNGYLSVTASRTNQKEEKDDQGKWIRQERLSGQYSRSFYVGDGIDEKDIKAHFENGELKITVPKVDNRIETNKKYIAIE